MAIPSHRAAALPDSVSFTEAAPLPVAGLTALRALRTGGPLLGSRVLVTGASGGVGTFAVQLARIAGAVVTAQVSGPARSAAVSALGASEVITEIGAEAGPFQLVLDGVGGQVLTAAVRRLARGGVVYRLRCRQWPAQRHRVLRLRTRRARCAPGGFLRLQHRRGNLRPGPRGRWRCLSRRASWCRRSVPHAIGAPHQRPWRACAAARSPAKPSWSETDPCRHIPAMVVSTSRPSTRSPRVIQR